LKYYLIAVYKRTLPGATLPKIIQQKGEDSLEALLNGVINRRENQNCKGLLKIAEKANEMLRSVKVQLDQASELTQVRKKYVHRGFAPRTFDGTWVFLKSGEEISEPQIIDELKRTSTDIQNLIQKTQENIPTPKS